MRNLIYILLFFTTFLLADEPVTKKDLSDSNRVLIELIKMNNDMVNKRFEDMQKHMDKRFEDMQKYMDKRFEGVDSKFNILLSVMIAGFTLIMGYLIKERHVSKEIEIEVEDINTENYGKL